MHGSAGIYKTIIHVWVVVRERGCYSARPTPFYSKVLEPGPIIKDDVNGYLCSSVVQMLSMI
jgi:hypothetical protein